MHLSVFSPFSGKRLVEEYPNSCYIVQNPASKPLTMQEISPLESALISAKERDNLYDLQSNFYKESETDTALMADKEDTFLKELCEYHVSGQLKVAPEHVADPVLKRMGKPDP